MLGRLPVITSTEALTEDALVSILTQPKNSLTSQYKRILANYGVSLEFTSDFLTSVAQEALASGIGARGLRSVMEKKLENALFEGPDLTGDKKIVANAQGVFFNPIANNSIYLKETKTEEKPEELSLESLVSTRREARKKKKNQGPKEVNE